MSGEELADDDDSEDEVVIVDTKKKDSKDDALKEIGNFGLRWELEGSYNLVKIVDEHGAHAPDKPIKEIWTEVVDDFNEVWKGKPHETCRGLKLRCEKLLAQSTKKGPGSQGMSDNEAKLWLLLEDHQRETQAKSKEKANKKKKKGSDAELARQGKEERDIASVAATDNTVTRLGGKEWTFAGGKLVAKKEDGTEFEVKMENIGKTPGGGGGHGATAASALLEMAKARQASEESKAKLMMEEARLRESAAQRRHEEEMKQRDQQFQVQMQQLQLSLSQMAMIAQLSQSGIAIPPMMLGNPMGVTFGAVPGAGTIGNIPNGTVSNNGSNGNNGNDNGKDEEPVTKKSHHNDDTKDN